MALVGGREEPAIDRLKRYKNVVDVEFLAWVQPGRLLDNTEHVARLAVIGARLDTLIEQQAEADKQSHRQQGVE